jgi:2-keto-3-deoxy-L-fuconate dehydrogenase
MPVSVDVLDAVALQELAEKLPQCDALVNCASVSSNGTVLECTEDAWDFAFDVNVKAMFLSVKALLPLIAESGGGSIVNMSSVAWDRGMPSRCAYSASKAAIIGFTKSVAADFVGHQIRCNVVCPGAIQTENLDARIAELGGDPEEVKRHFDARAPMGRLGTLEEVGQLIVYLVSDDSAYMTGTVQTIDGGAGLGNMHV